MIGLAPDKSDLVGQRVRCQAMRGPPVCQAGPERTPGAPQLARSIFAEAEGTVAVVSGSHYYSRDRAPGLPIEPSALTPQALAAAGARVATLSKARPREALPPYEEARTTGIAPVLEPRLSEFLAVRDR